MILESAFEAATARGVLTGQHGIRTGLTKVGFPGLADGHALRNYGLTGRTGAGKNAGISWGCVRINDHFIPIS